jgi:hypothetical protein
VAEDVHDLSESTRQQLDPGAVYQAVSARRISFDQMMWQVPALSLTAQSLLVAVSVNRDVDRLVRALALVLAIAFALLSMQLMAKQRFHEQVDSRYLAKWERAAGIVPVEGFAPHDRAASPWSGNTGTTGPSKADVLGIKAGRLVRLSSYTCWMWGLRLFLTAMVALLIWVPFS